MANTNKIIFNESLTLNIITDIINKIPGIDYDKLLDVAINKNHDVIDITFTPLKSVYNVYDIAKEIQDNVYFKLTKTFDLNKIVINTIVTTGKSKKHD
jgi:hypothetical protein